MESRSAISLARREECKGEWLTKEYKRMQKGDENDNTEPSFEEILRQEKMPREVGEDFVDPIKVQRCQKIRSRAVMDPTFSGSESSLSTAQKDPELDPHWSRHHILSSQKDPWIIQLKRAGTRAGWYRHQVLLPAPVWIRIRQK